jgi:hypothetical protein
MVIAPEAAFLDHRLTQGGGELAAAQNQKSVPRAGTHTAPFVHAKRVASVWPWQIRYAKAGIKT